MLFHVVLSQNGHLTLPVHELLESYVSLRYDDFDLDSVSPYLTRLANDFLISITVDSENEFKGPLRADADYLQPVVQDGLLRVRGRRVASLSSVGDSDHRDLQGRPDALHVLLGREGRDLE